MAAGLTNATAEPQSYASIFNNAAVALILSGKTEDDIKKAKSWLNRAMNIVDAQGVPVRGAKLAIYNSIQLDRSGLL